MAQPDEPYGCRILGQTTTQLFTNPPTTANRFGISISNSGDFLLVGAPLRTVTRADALFLPDDDGRRFESGCVYMMELRRVNDQVASFFWSLPAQPADEPDEPEEPEEPEDPAQPEEPEDPEAPGVGPFAHEDTPFPHNWIIRNVGSRKFDTGSCLNEITRNGGPRFNVANPFYIVGAAPGDRIGEVSGVRDINLDGVEDFVVGGAGTNSGRGAVYLIYRRQSEIEGDYFLENIQRSPNDPNRLNGLMIVGQQGENLGTALSGAGTPDTDDDYNDDSFSDVLIGAPDAITSAGFESGRAFILFGGKTLINPEGGVTIDDLVASGDGMVLTGAEAGDRAGETVASAGDINSDNIADFLISAPMASPPASVRLEFDSDDDGSLDADGVDLDGDGEPDDLNNDGRPDDLTDAGVVYVVFGGDHLSGTISLSDIGTASLPGFALFGREAGDQLGGGLTQNGLLSRGVAAAGDLDGDGSDDLIVSAILADPEGKTDAGEAYIVYGFSP